MSLYLKHRQSVGRGLIESTKIESNENSVKELPKTSKVVDDLPTNERIKKFEDLQKSLETLKLNEIKASTRGRPKKKPLSIKI